MLIEICNRMDNCFEFNVDTNKQLEKWKLVHISERELTRIPKQDNYRYVRCKNKSLNIVHN